MGIVATVAIGRACAHRPMRDAVALEVDIEILRSTRTEGLGRNEAVNSVLTLGNARFKENLGTNMDPRRSLAVLCMRKRSWFRHRLVSPFMCMHWAPHPVTMKVRVGGIDRQIAVEGCSHGELDAIYKDILENEHETGEKVDLVLLCGDVQVRTRSTHRA